MTLSIAFVSWPRSATRVAASRHATRAFTIRGSPEHPGRPIYGQAAPCTQTGELPIEAGQQVYPVPQATQGQVVHDGEA